MTTLRAFLIGVALAAAAAVPACGFEAADGASDRGTGGAASTTAGSGGDDGDASIDIGPGGQPAPDPYYRYTELCGEGCKPGGDPDGCRQQEDGAGGGGGASGAEITACQLVPGQNDNAEPHCGVAGSFDATGPCDTVASCMSGFGCAATPEGTGACRQYCCGHVEDCAQNTYCAPQPMNEDTDVQIPVCMPADKCTLLTDACGEGRTCSIVRADGTTSCVEPGMGQEGDACPCAAGFVCSLLTNQCKKLCHLDEDAADCGPDAKCQGGSMGFPPGFGICVGGDY